MFNALKKLVVLAATCALCTPNVACEKKSISIADTIIKSAQEVSDFARDQGFTYGHASINPGYNWGTLNPSTAIDPTEKITSCDRFVDWVLYRSGFVDQPYSHGLVVFQQIEWLESLGFEKITDVSALQAGDIIFSGYDSFRPNFPRHVFICGSSNLGNDVYLRYDHGSNERIACGKGTEVVPGQQPFKEPIYEFYYAYRPNDITLQSTQIEPRVYPLTKEYM